MRLGGFEVDPKFLPISFCLSSLFFLILSLVTSYSTGFLFLTSIFFGAVSFSIVLDACPNHLVPNLLFPLKSPKLFVIDCDLKKNSCHEPWKNLAIPVEIDNALTVLLERILRHYVYTWYGQISLDEEFVQEIRESLRYALVLLLKRFGQLDLTTLIIDRGIPIGVSHVDAFYRALQLEDQTSITEKFYKCVGKKHVHPATGSREKEIIHIQDLAKSISPFLLPKKLLKSRIVTTLVGDILSGSILQPLMDLLADPDTINFILEVAFSPEPTRKFPPASGEKVEILKAFVTSFQQPQNSTIRMDLSSILKDQSALFAFIEFLKDEGGINRLQFCLSIEDFNKRIFNPELNEDEVKSLHKEAFDLYNLYLKSSAVHKVEISTDIVESLKPIVLDDPVEDIVQLRTSTLLCRAYEEIYTTLENLCPSFHKSDQYYTFLLGKRNEDPQEKSRKNDAGFSATEKIGKGFTKLKQGVLGLSMDGLPIDSLDTAYDILETAQNSDEFDNVSINNSFADILEFRDLSTWRVKISKLSTAYDSMGKPCFVFVIEVHRADSNSQKGTHEDFMWCVERQYHEFYALESKLNEFHGEFEDAKLPPKSKFFSGRGLDVMQSRKEPFQDYLQTLLQKSALRESDMLFTFLTSNDEFTVATSNLGLGKMIKNVPLRLTKEKGQGLQPFIKSFTDSTQALSSKPRYDTVLPTEETLNLGERSIPPHPIFGDNFPNNQNSNMDQKDVTKDNLETKEVETGVFDTLMYLAVKIFQVSEPRVQLLSALRILIRNSFDHLVHYAISNKLSEVLNERRSAYLCQILEEALFDNVSHSRTDLEKEERRNSALKNFQSFIFPFWTSLMGSSGYNESTEIVFRSLQNPVINKQIAMVLLDTAVAELFPELEDLGKNN